MQIPEGGGTGGQFRYALSGLDPHVIEAQLTTGSRFVVFEYCISLIVVTLRRPSRVHLIRPGKTGLLRGFPYTILSLLLGWWGIPWGFIYTPLVILTNLSGGCDITADVRAMLREKSGEWGVGVASGKSGTTTHRAPLTLPERG